jgi:hypothetical protein
MSHHYSGPDFYITSLESLRPRFINRSGSRASDIGSVLHPDVASAFPRYPRGFRSSSTLNTASGMNPSRFGILTFGKLSWSSFPSSDKSPFRFRI